MIGRRSDKGEEFAGENAGANTRQGFLVGRTALVTGGGRNIGRAISLEMAREGANVLIADIDAGRARKVQSELAQHTEEAHSFVLDLSLENEVQQLCEEITNRGVPVDILVNNVGSTGPEMSDEEKFARARWQQMFDTNLFGSLSLSTTFAKRLRAQKSLGAIVFISSIHQWRVRHIPSYSASKAAIGMLVKEMAVEYAVSGIRVNGIAPGYVDIGAKGAPIPHKQTPLYGTSIPPEFVGRAAVYLASEHYSKYTTGTMLAIDAGLSLYSHLDEPAGRRR